MYLDTVKHLLWDEKLAASISLPLKTSKNQRFSEVFRRYGNESR